MDSKEIPKLRSASKLKLPEFGKTSKLINSLNIAGVSSERVPLPGALRRRSKSYSSLKPNTGKPVLSKTDLALNTNTLTTARLMIRSATKIVEKTATNGAAVARNVRPTKATVNTGIKRTITENKSDDEPKRKILKPVKIPAYDYKARFHQLEEIHSKLKSDHQTLKTTFDAYKTDKADLVTKYADTKLQNEALLLQLQNSNKEITIITAKNVELTATNANYLEKMNDDKLFIAKLTEEAKNLEAVILKLQDELREVKRKSEASNKEISDLTDLYKTVCVENNRSASRIEGLLEEIDSVKAEIERKDEVRQKLHNDIQDLKGNIRVYCRVRPQITAENKPMALIRCTDDTDIEIRRLAESVSAITGKTSETKQQFTFDHVFDENSTQADIFEELSQLVQSALDGYNVCIFAYGQTGSGKTFTMQGHADDHEGMIPRSLRVIFNYGERKKNFGWEFSIKASFLEIYNENLHDLLNMESKDHLEICFNEGNGISVRNLTIQPVETYSDLQKLMAVAHSNRTVAATDFNLHSSRSHAVTQINIEAFNKTSKTKLSSTINLVDLAGSESAKTSSQERITETKNINKSLSNLGAVMNALHTGKTHVPYRNSKLTFLLQSCLGGNAKTVMVVHVSPNDEAYSESVTSLRFAATVKSVKMNVKKNKSTT